VGAPYIQVVSRWVIDSADERLFEFSFIQSVISLEMSVTLDERKIDQRNLRKKMVIIVLLYSSTQDPQARTGMSGWGGKIKQRLS
jgi:hypothetical protein